MKPPINLALCKTYLENATHRGNCPRCWPAFLAAGEPCTCGLGDLVSLISAMESGAKHSVSVQHTVLTCDQPDCGLKDVPHKHVTVDK